MDPNLHEQIIGQLINYMVLGQETGLVSFQMEYLFFDKFC